MGDANGAWLDLGASTLNPKMKMRNGTWDFYFKMMT
jgi:hypothetical protein